MKKLFLSLTVLVALLIGSVAPVSADAGVTVAGGSLSVEPQAIDFGTVNLMGADILAQPGTTTAWVATDPTGTGAGWHVSIKATDFSNAGKTISISGLKMKVDSVTTVDGNAAPTIQAAFSAFTSLTPEDQGVLSAAVDEGMGTYSFTPAFTLDIPAETYAGTYTSTVTVSITSGPVQ